MTKSLAISILISLIAFGCASTNENVSDNSSGNLEDAEPAQAKAENKNAGKLSDVAPPDSKAEPTPAPAKTIRYDALNAAIAGKNDERIKSASIEILQNNPKDPKALNSLAMSYYLKGNTEAAFMLLNKILTVEPRSSTAHNNLGLVYLARGERREAIEMFKRALQYDGSNYQAAANLGSIYAKEKDYAKAVIALEKAVGNDKVDDQTLNNYAMSLSATDKASEAARIFERILSKNSSNKNAMLNLAVVYIEKLNKLEEGLDLINRLKFVGPDLESRQIIKDLEIKAKAGLK